MPENKISESAVKAMTAQETDAVMLHLLTLSYNDTPLLRAVDDRRNIVSNGETYNAIAFSVLLPDQGSDGNKSCRLQIDNTDIAVYRAIKNAIKETRNSNSSIEASVSVVLSSEPDECIQGPLNFILRNITATVQSITGELYDMYLADRNVTNLTYSPEKFPGLFF